MAATTVPGSSREVTLLFEPCRTADDRLRGARRLAAGGPDHGRPASLVAGALLLGSGAAAAGCAVEAPHTYAAAHNTGSGGSAGGAGSGGGGGGSAGSGGSPFRAARHRPYPKVTANGAGFLAKPRVVAIVAENEEASARAAYFALAQAFPTSAWYPSWSTPYQLAKARPSVTLTGAALPSGTLIDQTSGPAYIRQAMAASPSTPPGEGRTVFFIFLPQGVTYGGMSPGVIGIHWAYDDVGDAWGVVERDPMDPTNLETVTVVASHELAEAMTDTPFTGYNVFIPPGTDPWKESVWASWEGVSSMYGGAIEIGDFCEGTRYHEGAVAYQRIFTNQAAAAGGDPCVPALPVPYFNLSADQDWYSGKAGSTVTIPVNGWSTGPTADFWVYAEVAAQSDGSLQFGAALANTRAATFKSGPLDVMNNGDRASLMVTIPASAPSGSWVIASTWAGHYDQNEQTPPGEDLSHLFAVGVFVP